MSEYTSPKKNVPAGLPLWVMTFADLMTLLMCFFVLILSFSEMDILKYKQLAGSMAHAFGVQRDIEARDPPKGINIIAREFSPGQPQPTPLNVVRQKTTSDLRIHLEVGGEKTRPTPAPRVRNQDPKEQATMKSEQPVGEPITQEEILQREQELQKKLEDMQVEQEAVKKEREEIERMKEEIRQREEALRELEQGEENRLDDATAEEILAAREARERKRELEENAEKILNELEEQILAGAVDVEREGQKIIIRIREKASFGSGSAEVVASFKPVLWRLGEIIEGMEGRVVVAGHTDNIPISTPRFRSNWELSAGRAVSVVHELLWQTAMPLERFLVQGHGETHPVASNDSPADRARNRRVEIILTQGDDQEAEQEISQQGLQPQTRSAAVAEAGKPKTPDAVTQVIPAMVEVPEEAIMPTGAGKGSIVEDEAQAEAAGAAPPVDPVVEAGADTGTATPEPELAPAVASPPTRPTSGISAGTARPVDRPGRGESGVTAGALRPPVTPDQEQVVP
jgi:chemotaxis protein MotB